MQTLTYKVNFAPEGIPTTVRLSQNENGRSLQFVFIGDRITIPNGSVVTISGTKPDGHVYSAEGTLDGEVATFDEEIQMTAAAGEWAAKLKVTHSGLTVATQRLWMIIDADTVLPGSVPSESELNGLVAEAQQYAENARSAAYGSPLTAALEADMLDTSRVYVYTGSETGMIFGHWYYYEDGEWEDGGVYQSQGVQTDTTLSIPGMPADAGAAGDALAGKVNAEVGKGLSSNDFTTAEKTKLAGIADQATWVLVDNTLKQSGQAADSKIVGDEIDGLKEDLSDTSKILEPEETEADLYICDQQGNVIAKFEDGHVKTKNFDSSDVGSNMIMDTSSTEADLYICDSFGNTLAEFKDGHVITKKFDSSDYDGVIDDVDDLQADTALLQKACANNIINRNKDMNDGVYAACGWHRPTNTSKQFCLLMGADIHGDATRMNSMVEYLNAVDAFDAGILLGDIAGNTWQDDAVFYTDAISNTQKPLLTVIGNHDAGEGNTIATSYTNVADLVAKFITPNIDYADLASGEYPSGKSYYYKDFDAYGIRLIVLNSYEYPSDNDGVNFLYVRGSNCWSQEQVDWFISILDSTPTTYGVIVATHFTPSRIAITLNDPFTSSTMKYQTYNVITMLTNDSATMLPEIVNAWINGASLSKTYDFTVDGSWENITVSADFTNRGTGEFIAWIGGHLHMSLIAAIYGFTDQKVFLINSTSMTAQGGDLPRKVGTRSEDALCALAVDRSNKTVKLFNVGAHFTKDGKERVYGAYSYAEEE